LFVSLMVTYMLSSCKKTNLPNRPVDADLKAAFSYLPGTYWIYRDSISGHVDSFFVTQDTHNNYNYNSQYTFDQITVRITAYNVASFADSDTWEISLYQSTIAIDYDIDLYSKNTDGIDYYPLTYPFTDGEYIGSTGTNVNTLSILGNYVVDGKTFNNVAQVNYVDGTNDYFYISSDVGIIKMRLYDNVDSVHVWELERWNIVK